MNLFRNLFPSKRIYLDYAAATPVLDEVRKEMDRFWSRDFYNPSALYTEGVKMREVLESYRTRVARTIGAGKKDIVFTSGGTESINMAILGTFEAFKETLKSKTKKPHIIISSIEHPAVVEAAREVERRGGVLSVVEVNQEGLVSPQAIVDLLRPETFLVSVMLANNEIGTIEPASKIGRLLREERKKRQKIIGYNANYPYLHTDASQAPNYIEINVEALHADLITLDGSKIYGPKGSGVLVVRPGVSIRPIILGGGQERELRSGTENLSLIAGFSKALEIAVRDREKESLRVEVLKHYFTEKLTNNYPQLIINGSKDHSLPNIVSVSMPGVMSEMILLALDIEGVIVSVGSACSGRSREDGSPIIRAIGREEYDESTLRFSFGRQTSKNDLDKALRILGTVLERAKIQLRHHPDLYNRQKM
jgi:cysteine desulfurase